MKIQKILKENMIEISKSQYGRHVLMQLDKGRFKWFVYSHVNIIFKIRFLSSFSMKATIEIYLSN